MTTVGAGGRWLMSWPGVLFLAVVSGAYYTQFPLYYTTQNQYFFHGFVRAGIGLLRDDWLAGTPDTWPVFSRLVTLTYRLDTRLFYVYFVLLLGVYAYSMLGIVSSVSAVKRSGATSLVFAAGLAALHSPIVGALSTKVVGFNVGGQLTTGVALQNILGPMLQPSTFGVFLLLSIYLFLRGRSLLAVASSSLAALIHPTYILSAGIVTLSYMIIVLRRGDGLRSAVTLGLWACALILPMLVYVYVAFPSTSHDLTNEARAILVHFRFPHHASPGRWFGPMVLVKVAVTLVALSLIRRTELFVILLVFLGAGVGLTVYQVLTGSDALALLFPWRLSVFFVPISTAVILASILSGPVARLEARAPAGGRVVAAVSVAILIVLASVGVAETQRRFALHRTLDRTALMEFVRATRAKDAVYLTPQYWYTFRLFTGAPAFIDWDFIPYSDVAVIEWHRRFRLADAFYKASGERRCQMLADMKASYKITHAVVREEDTEICSNWKLLFRSGDLRLYAVTL